MLAAASNVVSLGVPLANRLKYAKIVIPIKTEAILKDPTQSFSCLDRPQNEKETIIICSWNRLHNEFDEGPQCDVNQSRRREQLENSCGWADITRTSERRAVSETLMQMEQLWQKV